MLQACSGEWDAYQAAVSRQMAAVSRMEVVCDLLRRGRPRVLVCEDDYALASVYLRVLGGAYDVTWAASEQEAGERIGEGVWDLVLADSVGFGAVRAMRAAGDRET